MPYQKTDSPVGLNFAQPIWYRFYKGQYNIGYTPWESTSLPPDWVDAMNQCDEIWTTSEWCKSVFEDAGVTRPMNIYQHGIEHIWTPKQRIVQNKFKVLHVGEPAPRKGGQMALDAFRAAFGDSEDVELTIKGHTDNTTRSYKDGQLWGSPDKYPNVRLTTGTFDIANLISLYHQHHAMIYPSYGEGFGFIPLQAVATGMPTITTSAFCPYTKYVMGLDSKLVDSPWPLVHPGQVYEPSFDHLVEQLRELRYNYETYAEQAYRNSFRVHVDYDWMNLTKDAFQNVVEKFS